MRNFLTRPRLFFVALYAVHLLGILYYLPTRELLENPPIVNTDYATHFYQSARVTQLLQESGRSWGYDPYLLGGYPLGTVFDLNNKGLEIGTWLLSPIVGIDTAYNLVLALLFITLPLPLYAAARLIGLSAWARSLAVLFGLLLWYTDASLHWAWAGGTFSFAVASVWTVYSVAAFVRYMNDPGLRAWIVLASAASLTILLSPQIVIALGAPILAGYLLSFSRLQLRQHAALLLIAAVVLTVNAFWIGPFLSFSHIKTSSAQFLQADLSTLGADLLGVGRIDGGARCYCGLRWLTVGLALTTWWRGRRANNTLSIFGVGIASLLGLAYLGTYVQPLADMQPYRFVISASLMAALPAAHALTLLFAHPPRIRLQTILAMLLITFFIVRAAQAVWEVRPDLSRLGQPVQSGDGRLAGPSDSYAALFDWLAENTSRDGRLLVNDWRVGTLIPYYVEREVIGGPFLWTWIEHGYANAGIWDAFGRDLDSYTQAELSEVMQAFNVKWVVTNARFDSDFYTFDDVARLWPDMMQLIDEVAGYRVYRTRWPADEFLVGSGDVSAQMNRLTVSDASAGRVVLKYHWLPTLRSEPPLPIRAYAVLDDPVGFIEVDNGAVRDFVIYNGYR